MKNYLDIAFKNASLATNQIKSNPKVGALIIENGKVIAEGIHEVYGGPHAEINALNQVNASLEDAELVVTLEPCSHHGKTPPCVDAIIDSGIKKVTIGTLDPNPIVSGNGVKKLKDAGIEVIIKNDIASQLAINQDYYKKIQTHLPYISLKTAMSLDGKIALSNRQSKWITSNASREKVQQLRNEAGAILVGVGTILKDNPRLTVHDEPLYSPVRIILDTHLKTPLDAYVVKSAKEVPTWIFTSSQASQDYTDLGVKIFQVPLKNNRLDLERGHDTLRNLANINNNYFNIDKSRVYLSDGVTEVDPITTGIPTTNSVNKVSNNIGLSNSDFLLQNSFTGFDFSTIWSIDDSPSSYPYLTWQGSAQDFNDPTKIGDFVLQPTQ